MGKVKFFFLRFHNRSRIYHAGEQLTGSVVVDLKEAAQIQSIEVCVYEKPCIRFPVGTGPGCCSTVFTEAELIGQPVLVFPSDVSADSSGEEELDEGFHTINFSVPLPADIPSSFESMYGKVQYYLVAEMELSGPRAVREKTKSSFKVINPVDLSLFPQTQRSCQQQARVGLSSGPLPGRLHSRHLDVLFHVNKGGYIPGEKVKIYGKINNGTTVHIRKSYVELVQVINMRTNGKVKTVRTPVTGLRHHSIPAGETDVWDTDCLAIPELPSSSLDPNRGNFTIAYCLQLVIVPAGLLQKIKLPIEIVIGTSQGSGPLPEELDPPAYHHHLGPGCLPPLPFVDLQPQDQFDIMDTHRGRNQCQIAQPPPYLPADEPPPPYEEIY